MTSAPVQRFCIAEAAGKLHADAKKFFNALPTATESQYRALGWPMYQWIESCDVDQSSGQELDKLYHTLIDPHLSDSKLITTIETARVADDLHKRKQAGTLTVEQERFEVERLQQLIRRLHAVDAARRAAQEPTNTDTSNTTSTQIEGHK